MRHWSFCGLTFTCLITRSNHLQEFRTTREETYHAPQPKKSWLKPAGNRGSQCPCFTEDAEAPSSRKALSAVALLGTEKQKVARQTSLLPAVLGSIRELAHFPAAPLQFSSLPVARESRGGRLRSSGPSAHVGQAQLWPFRPFGSESVDARSLCISYL